MSPSSPCCGFCRKPPERDGDCSKWKKISDTSSLQAFWCDLTTLRGSNDKSFATRKACKVCGECNTLWKQWAKAFQTLKALQLKKEDLLGKLNKVIPYANGSVPEVLSVKHEPMSDIDDEDLFLPSEYSQPQLNMGSMLDVMMNSEGVEGDCKSLPETLQEENSMDSRYSPILMDDDDDDAIEQALKDEALGVDEESDADDSDDFEEDDDDKDEDWETESDEDEERSKKRRRKKKQTDDSSIKDQTEVEGKKRIVCEFCGPLSKRFWSVTALINHLEQKHSGETKSHSCTYPSCNDSFPTSIQLDEHFRRHLRDWFKIPQLSCRFCPMRFTTAKRRENHETQQHKNSTDGSQSSNSKSSNKFVCSICGKLYPSYKSLKHHENTGHGRMVFCEICPPDKNYRSHDRLLAHILSEHENEPSNKFIQCPKCPSKFATKFLMKKHFEGHLMEADKPLSCLTCEKRFAATESDALAAHVKAHEAGYEKPQTKYKCAKCPREFAAVQKTQLYRHERKHHPELLIHTCQECDRRYSVKEFLDTHMKIHDKNGPYVCLVCCSRYGSRLVQGGYPFETGELLDIHLKKHTGENYKICEVCGEKFETQNILLHHMSKVHGAERKYACNLCEKRYPTPSDLSAHVRSSHEQRWRKQDPLKCPECDSVFFNKPSLRNHVRRVHRQAERKVCEQCGKTLRSGVALRDHMNMHEGIKNFVCEWCDKRFVRKDELVMHTYIHTGFKPHKCYICQKGFTQRHSMKTHMKVHERNGTWIPKPPDAN